MITEPHQDPNEVVAMRRKQLGLTAAELAARVGYEPSIGAKTIEMIEANLALVPLPRCRKFAAALDVDEGWFALCTLRKQFPDAAGAIERGIAPRLSAG